MKAVYLEDWVKMRRNSGHVYYDILNNELMVDYKIKAGLFVDLQDNTIYIYIGEL